MYYNKLKLPGFDTARPLHKEPRWMIVWDDRGWTSPARRVIVAFNGKFIEKSGVSWDHASELPVEYLTDEWEYWRRVDAPTKEHAKLLYDYATFIQSLKPKSCMGDE